MKGDLFTGKLFLCFAIHVNTISVEIAFMVKSLMIA